jgi:hypothetical protein
VSKLEIHVAYDPKWESDWMVSYGVPTRWFRTRERRIAVDYAKQIARRNRPGTIVIHDLGGGVQRRINIRKGSLFVLVANSEPSLWITCVGVVLIGLTFALPWLSLDLPHFVGAALCYPFIRLNRHFKSQVNTSPLLRTNHRKVLGYRDAST